MPEITPDDDEREMMFCHRDKIYEAENSRLSGEPMFTPEQVHEELEALYDDAAGHAD